MREEQSCNPNQVVERLRKLKAEKMAMQTHGSEVSHRWERWSGLYHSTTPPQEL